MDDSANVVNVPEAKIVNVPQGEELAFHDPKEAMKQAEKIRRDHENLMRWFDKLELDEMTPEQREKHERYNSPTNKQWAEQAFMAMQQGTMERLVKEAQKKAKEQRIKDALTMQSA